MFEISKTTSFEAAHRIIGHIDPVTGLRGKCDNLHGHTYKVLVCIATKVLPEDGMVMDYGKLNLFLKKVVEIYDHSYLNTIPGFRSEPGGSGELPTAENLAQAIAADFMNWAKSEYPDETANRFRLQYIEVSETETSRARYYPPNESFYYRGEK